MIQQLPIWQMAVDFGLVAAVLTMAIRWMKCSKAQSLLPQTLELEAALKNLIAEAEVAGRHLNDQLLRREANIQKYLGELEESEHRITRSIVEGEEVSKRIEELSATAQARLQDLLSARGGRPSASARQPEAATLSGQPLAQQPPQQPIAKPARQASEPSARPTRPAVQQQPAEAASRQAQQRPSEPAPPKPAAGNARSAQAYGAASRRDSSDIQKVYAAAEKMIREGVDAEKISSATKIPLEGVKLLSQMIEVERTDQMESAEREDQMIAGDPRLGALGLTRRQPNA